MPPLSVIYRRLQVAATVLQAATSLAETCPSVCETCWGFRLLWSLLMVEVSRSSSIDAEVVKEIEAFGGCG
ncbi:hypothetical protein F5Y05DRAFT_376965 [Hypoxylon sp. FL0543]|nr:hypothetical protein F5Y05DRAFT_376965 [Hypoxylon sp. FL0543]